MTFEQLEKNLKCGRELLPRRILQESQMGNGELRHAEENKEGD